VLHRWRVVAHQGGPAAPRAEQGALSAKAVSSNGGLPIKAHTATRGVARARRGESGADLENDKRVAIAGAAHANIKKLWLCLQPACQLPSPESCRHRQLTSQGTKVSCAPMELQEVHNLRLVFQLERICRGAARDNLLPVAHRRQQPADDPLGGGGVYAAAASAYAASVRRAMGRRSAGPFGARVFFMEFPRISKVILFGLVTSAQLNQSLCLEV